MGKESVTKIGMMEIDSDKTSTENIYGYPLKLCRLKQIPSNSLSLESAEPGVAR